MRCGGGGSAGDIGCTVGAFAGASVTFRFCEALLPLRGGVRDDTFKRVANLADNGAGYGGGVGALIYSYLTDFGLLFMVGILLF